MPTRKTKESAARGNNAAVEINAALLRKLRLPQLDEEGDKESRGRVLVIGGSDEMPGALLLAGAGALRAGAGKLQLATAHPLAPSLGAHLPEARVFQLEGVKGRIDPRALDEIGRHVLEARALLVGPGMTEKQDFALLVKRLLSLGARATLVLDANALNALRGKTDWPRFLLSQPAILTPHATELAEMTGADERALKRDPLSAARRAAFKFGAVVALKGRETFVASPDGKVFVNRAGNVGLATSGSGDVLAGVVAGLAARGADPLTAAVWGVHAHALAGERLARRVGRVGYLARELLGEIPSVLDGLDGK